MITVQYFGHSFWRMTIGDISLVFDPYSEFGYPLPRDVNADIVCVSHDHFDHNNVGLIGNVSLVVREPGHYQYRDLAIDMYSTFHDEQQGKKRGKNLIAKITWGDRVIIHCGDLGAIPEPAVLRELRNPDVLFLPVGGYYTIDAETAFRFASLLEPNLVFPMHYRTKYVDTQIQPVASYIRLVGDAIHMQADTIDLSDDLFRSPKTITLHYE